MNEDMLVHILETDYHIVDVDPRKNRIYVRVLKDAEKASEPSRFLEELHEVKHYLRDGFTMLVERRKKETAVQKNVALIHDIMDLLFEGGIKKVADVRSEYSNFQDFPDLMHEQVCKGIKHKEFFSRDAAEVWLDAA